MQRIVQGQELRLIVARDRTGLIAQQSLEFARVSRRHFRGREAGRPTLDRFANELAIGNCIEVDRRNHRSDLRAHIEKTLTFEADDRLAHRRPADAEPRRDLVLGDRPAGQKARTEDFAAQPGVRSARGAAPAGRGCRVEKGQGGHRACTLAYKLRQTATTATGSEVMEVVV